MSKAATPTPSGPSGILILGNQLFAREHFPEEPSLAVFMREDAELCTHYKYHRLKIVLFLSAMRAYAEELRAEKFTVDYHEMDSAGAPYEEEFARWIKKRSLKKIYVFEIEDKFFEKRLLELLGGLKIELVVLPSPMFLTSREQFKDYLGNKTRPFMRTFYEGQRKRLGLLVNKKGEPDGGQWSFDEENRKPLPKTVHPPVPAVPELKPHVARVEKLCDKLFPEHPGKDSKVWFATDREGALAWLDEFLKKRFAEFGPYEDALAPNSDFVFHSALTPYLNTGLLTPDEIIARALAAAKKQGVELATVEGFTRQIIGWREFIRGIYQNFSETQERRNHFGHEKKLSKLWYEGRTGIPPLDQAIDKANRYGYCHHIERLMVVGNLMLLSEIAPSEAHRWFMEMFIDSSDWVMGPNVYGMALFSDGGIFATKPYICGSNYYRKMGGYPKGDWCDEVDGLYWSFIEKHAKDFKKNPRMAMMVNLSLKMDTDKKKRLYAAADRLRARLTG